MSNQLSTCSMRPRERLLSSGAEALSDTEILALFLRSGLPGGSATDLAESVLGKFGSLRGLLSAHRNEVLKVRGVGGRAYACLAAALEIMKRIYREPLVRSSVLEQRPELQAFLLAQVRDRPVQMLCCLYLDESHRLISFEEMFSGTLDRVYAHPREIVRRMLHHCARGVISVRNDPDGFASPTEHDRLFVSQLSRSIEVHGHRMVDHIVVGDGEFYSFEEEKARRERAARDWVQLPLIEDQVIAA